LDVLQLTMEETNEHNEFKTLPRPLAVIGGVLLLFFALIFLWVGFGLAIGLRSEPSALKVIIAALSLYASVKLLVFSWRLLLNRPRPGGGLLSPFVLRVTGLFMVLLPIAGFFTGWYEASSSRLWPNVFQGVVYIFAGGGLILLARVRSKHLTSPNTATNASTNRIQEVLSRLKQKYRITDTWSGEKGEFKVSGIDDTLYIDFLSCNHFILHNNCSWHEHFMDQSGNLYGRDGSYTLEEFLVGLFTGTIQITVKYRGDTPVAQEVGFVGEGEFVGIHHTSILRLKSFFKKTWYKKLEYKLDNKKLEGTTQ